MQKGGLTLPARVKERQHDRDDQRRDAVPLLAGEGRMEWREPTKCTRSLISLSRGGKGHAAVHVKWETVAAPPSEQELRKIIEATAKADWLQEVRVALGKKVAEIRRIGEAQGDKGLLQARGAANTLLVGATPEWVTNQEGRRWEEKDALREEARVAKKQLKELRER